MSSTYDEKSGGSYSEDDNFKQESETLDTPMDYENSQVDDGHYNGSIEGTTDAERDEYEAADAQDNEQHVGHSSSYSDAGTRNSRKIFVGRLPRDCTNEMLLERFEAFGTVENAYLLLNVRAPRAQRCRGMGFVVFAEKESMEKAIAAASKGEVELEGAVLEVRHALDSATEDSDPCRIYLAPIPSSIDEDMLRQYFSSYGGVVALTITQNRARGPSSLEGHGAFAFLNMEHPDHAQRVLDESPHDIHGHPVNAVRARQKPRRGGPPRDHRGPPRGGYRGGPPRDSYRDAPPRDGYRGDRRGGDRYGGDRYGGYRNDRFDPRPPRDAPPRYDPYDRPPRDYRRDPDHLAPPPRRYDDRDFDARGPYPGPRGPRGPRDGPPPRDGPRYPRDDRERDYAAPPAHYAPYPDRDYHPRALDSYARGPDRAPPAPDAYRRSVDRAPPADAYASRGPPPAAYAPRRGPDAYDDYPPRDQADYPPRSAPREADYPPPRDNYRR